ncbi:uncharacterized protein LOC105698878 [Orussus abietinus]|uniref:uncharacterized protein LOC105698878 n=1 Tax=Orussus abietinus TaxID=222816 RepID=UPI000625F414|nr:uncharacterized protein LOC105698878 [Orussus abietinus]
MLLLKSFFRRIAKDFRQKELLPLKMIFFVQASTLFVLYPYLTIHMRELGINVEETAIMSAVTPFVAIVMPPLAGLVADRIGNFKILLAFFSGMGGAASLLLLLVPVGRVTVDFPDSAVFDLGCTGSESAMTYTMSQIHPCETRLQPEVATRLESCGYACHVDLHDQGDLEAILASRFYTVRRYDTSTGQNSSFKYTISKSDLPREVAAVDDVREHRKLTNNEFYKTSIRQLSKSTFFFPTSQLFEFNCSQIFSEGRNTTEEELISEDRTFCTFGQLLPDVRGNASEEFNSRSYKSILKSLNATDIDLLEEKRRYRVEKLAWNSDDPYPVICENPDRIAQKVSLSLPLVNYTTGGDPYKTLLIEACSKRCIVTAPRKDVCANMQTEIEYDVRLTFWLYLAIRVFIGMIGGTAFAMFEGACIAILREQKADYGLQRIYGSIGGMISSPLSGLMIDYASSGKEYTDFRPAFYLYAALKIVGGALMLTINLEFKRPSSNVISDVIGVLKNIEIVALLIACFVLGTAWGYIESFLFWLLQDLGGSRSLMGITITVGGIAGVPLLVMSGPIIEKIGHANVLFVGFVFYAIRLLGYSMIYNPWHCLIFEAMESVTSSLSFTAAVTYAARLSTTTTDSSIQGLLAGLYYGVGRGCGSLIGGYLMKAFGTRPTYQIFAVVSLATGVIYYIFNMAYLKKRPQVEGNDIVKKKPKPPKDTGGLENGTIEMKASTKDGVNEKIIAGTENKAFADDSEKENPEVDSNEIETTNNAKNLDKIERISDKKRKSVDLKIVSDDHEKDGPRKRILDSGVNNPAFEREKDGKYDVIVEREPEIKK